MHLEKCQISSVDVRSRYKMELKCNQRSRHKFCWVADSLENERGENVNILEACVKFYEETNFGSQKVKFDSES